MPGHLSAAGRVSSSTVFVSLHRSGMPPPLHLCPGHAPVSNSLVDRGWGLGLWPEIGPLHGRIGERKRRCASKVCAVEQSACSGRGLWGSSCHNAPSPLGSGRMPGRAVFAQILIRFLLSPAVNYQKFSRTRKGPVRVTERWHCGWRWIKHWPHPCSTIGTTAAHRSRTIACLRPCGQRRACLRERVVEFGAGSDRVSAASTGKCQIVHLRTLSAPCQGEDNVPLPMAVEAQRHIATAPSQYAL